MSSIGSSIIAGMNNDPLILLAIALLGWFIGALVNYFSDILPVKRRLAKPICAACLDPMPGINYWLWPRRCPECWSRRSWRTWAVEIIFMAASVWLWLNPPVRFGFWAGLLLLAFFGVVFVIDMEHRLILHMVSIFGAVLGLVLGIYMRGLWVTLLGGAAEVGSGPGCLDAPGACST